MLSFVIGALRQPVQHTIVRYRESKLTLQICWAGQAHSKEIAEASQASIKHFPHTSRLFVYHSLTNDYTSSSFGHHYSLLSYNKNP